MNLNNFEQHIEPIIVERGKSYYRQGMVGHIKHLGPGEYNVTVTGSELYDVYVSLNPNLSIIESSCTCPYDLGAICKHQVAVFYALLNLDDGTDTVSTNLKQLLEQQSKEQLINLLLNLAREIEGVDERLLFQLASNEDELTQCRRLIQSTIERFTMGDFISYKYVRDALQGVYVVQEKIASKIENLELLSALQLAIVVIHELMEMLSITDDSGGSVGMEIDEAIGYVQEICQLSSEFSAEMEKNSIFQQTLEVAKNSIFEGWIDWKGNLLIACVELCDTDERKEQFTMQLELLKKQVNRQSEWISDYKMGMIQKVQLAFIERTEDVTTVEEYLMQHIENRYFRKRLIEQAMEAQDFEKVLSLLPTDKKQRRLWREEELAAYEGLGNVGKQRQIIRQFIVDGKKDYYEKYKRLYSVDEWPTVHEKLIDELSVQHPISNAYTDILIAEKLWHRLLEFCEKHIDSISKYYIYLKENYEDQAKEIYIKYLLQEANSSSNRSQYRAVCHKIKQFQNECGKEITTQLITQLQGTYKKRPAFLDELSKV